MSYYVYASFRARCDAEMALEEYYAIGIVCHAERPLIARRGNRYVVLFQG